MCIQKPKNNKELVSPDKVVAKKQLSHVNSKQSIVDIYAPTWGGVLRIDKGQLYNSWDIKDCLVNMLTYRVFL